MLNQKTKLRLRKLLRARRRQVEGISGAADKQLEKHFFRRLGRLVGVKRFVAGWLTLIAVLLVVLFLQGNALQDKYLSVQPSPGGTFTEGIVGNYSNANPLYATGTVDAAVSKLIFAGLYQYDSKGSLVPNLAENLVVDSTEKKYTVTLKPNLVWHDGQKLDSEDVVFTYQLIQNPDAGSYLYPSWKGVSIEAVDERTVVFTLPDRLSGFRHSLTNGLVPKHVLEDVDPEQLRSSDFNTVRPVGAGPFKFDAVEVEATGETGEGVDQQERIGLSAFDNYVIGRPHLNRFLVRTFADHDSMEQAFERKEITSMAGLTTSPEDLDRASTREITLPLSGQVMVFFKVTQKPFDSKEVRRALILGLDRSKVLNAVGYPLLPSDSPLLRSHIGYNETLTQQTGNIKAARQILDRAGWKLDSKDGVRKRDKIPLSFNLYSEANSEYASVTQSLQKQWREIGADVKVNLQSTQDLQSTVSTHNYDALLYAISVGADPDVYAYWHSSQADIRSGTRLNFSEYKSQLADIALEGGRSRSDPKIRAAKYRPFLKAWTQDNPALALYQPRYLYIVREPFYGFDMESLVNPVDRFANVERWMIREEMK